MSQIKSNTGSEFIGRLRGQWQMVGRIHNIIILNLSNYGLKIFLWRENCSVTQLAGPWTRSVVRTFDPGYFGPIHGPICGVDFWSGRPWSQNKKRRIIKWLYWVFMHKNSTVSIWLITRRQERYCWSRSFILTYIYSNEFFLPVECNMVLSVSGSLKNDVLIKPNVAFTLTRSSLTIKFLT